MTGVLTVACAGERSAFIVGALNPVFIKTAPLRRLGERDNAPIPIGPPQSCPE